MAKTPTFLARTPVDVPNRSGFAMPFENLCTGRTGTLYPVLCKRVVPNETYSEEILFEAELPPMVSNFFGRVDLCFESFFVPNHLLWGGWDDFFTHPTNNPIYPDGTPVAAKPHNIPHILCPTQSWVDRVTKRGSLADFLGAKFSPVTSGSSASSVSLNSLPFLAYHRIYHDHYRNSVVQAPVFYNPPQAGTSTASYAATLPYTSGVYTTDESIKDNVRDINASSSASAYATSPFLGDGVEIFSLRQSNFDLDYFTAATPQPQAGGAATLTFDVAVDPSTGDGTGSFSIASLRMQNSIQQWMERNGLAGYDYQEQNFVQYGAYPKRNLTKALYLGSYREPVYNRSVFQTAQGANSSGNPFGGVGAKFGASMANGRNVLFDNFKATDHGYIVVMMSLRPHAYYGSGVNRDLVSKYIGDIPFPLLSGVGDQPIYNYELLGFGIDANTTQVANSVFGFIDQYANDKCCLDEVHGEFREGGKLEEFVLQRTFSFGSGVHQISSDFLEIPQDFLDQVKEVKSDVVPVDYWISIFHNFNKVSPLPVYSVPTLGRLPNTHTETVSRKKSTI